MKDYCRWTGEVEGYARRQCSLYARQLAGQYDIDDLYQEAYLLFDKALRMFGEKCVSESQFMAYYKRMFFRRFSNMIRDTQVAARLGRGGIWLGEYDQQVVDKHVDVPCLDDEPDDLDVPDGVGRALAKTGLIPTFRGRRYTKTRRKNGESKDAYFDRLVGGDEHDVAEARAHLRIGAAVLC